MHGNLNIKYMKVVFDITLPVLYVTAYSTKWMTQLKAKLHILIT
jgi:hypothetical protein